MQDGIPVLNQPAGHVENNESIAEALVREALEESGWLVEPLGVLGFYALAPYEGADTYHRVCIVCKALEQKTLNLDSDILESHWLSIDDIDSHALRSPLVKKCIDNYLEMLNTDQPLIPLSAFNNEYL